METEVTITSAEGGFIVKSPQHDGTPSLYVCKTLTEALDIVTRKFVRPGRKEGR